METLLWLAMYPAKTLEITEDSGRRVAFCPTSPSCFFY